MGINYVETNWGNLSDLDFNKLNAMSRNNVHLKNVVDRYPTGIIAWRKATSLNITSTAYEAVSSLTISIDRSQLNFTSPRSIKITFWANGARNKGAQAFLYSRIRYKTINTGESWEAGFQSDGVLSNIQSNIDAGVSSHVALGSMTNESGVSTAYLDLKVSTGSLDIPVAYLIVEDMGLDLNGS